MTQNENPIQHNTLLTVLIDAAPRTTPAEIADLVEVIVRECGSGTRDLAVAMLNLARNGSSTATIVRDAIVHYAMTYASDNATK